MKKEEEEEEANKQTKTKKQNSLNKEIESDTNLGISQFFPNCLIEILNTSPWITSWESAALGQINTTSPAPFLEPLTESLRGRAAQGIPDIGVNPTRPTIPVGPSQGSEDRAQPGSIEAGGRRCPEDENHFEGL